MPAVARTQSHDAITPATKPANDPSVADGAPDYTLSPKLRAQWMAKVKRIAAKTIKRVPPYLAQRIEWMQAVQTAAWRDRAALVAVDVPGAPLTEDDVRDLGFALSFLSDVSAERDVAVLVGTLKAPSALSDAELKAEMVSRRGSLCDALSLYFKGRPDALAKVRAIRGLLRADLHASANRSLFTLLKEEKLADWLRALPGDDADALARLRLLHAEWTSRRASSQADEPADLVARAWTLANEHLDAILSRGRFLSRRGLARASDYAGFRRPVTRTRAAPQPAPAPQPPPVRPT